MTVSPSVPDGDEDILYGSDGGDVAVLTLPPTDDALTVDDAVTTADDKNCPNGAEYDGEKCPHCGAPALPGQTLCRRCGFYPALNTFVEVDAEEDELVCGAPQPARSHRPTPEVPCNLQVLWLEPKLMCTVWYEDWTGEGQLIRPFFDKLQPDFEPAKKTTAP